METGGVSMKCLTNAHNHILFVFNVKSIKTFFQWRRECSCILKGFQCTVEVCSMRLRCVCSSAVFLSGIFTSLMQCQSTASHKVDQVKVSFLILGKIIKNTLAVKQDLLSKKATQGGKTVVCHASHSLGHRHWYRKHCTETIQRKTLCIPSGLRPQQPQLSDTCF